MYVVVPGRGGRVVGVGDIEDLGLESLPSLASAAGDDGEAGEFLSCFPQTRVTHGHSCQSGRKSCLFTQIAHTFVGLRALLGTVRGRDVSGFERSPSCSVGLAECWRRILGSAPTMQGPPAATDAMKKEETHVHHH
jgi:hypothetical protein